MRPACLIACWLGGMLACPAQSVSQVQPVEALLSAREADQLFERSIQLMQATAALIPGLSRASEPLIENARQANSMLKIRAGNMEATYSFLMSLRSYLTLADAAQRPFPVPVEAESQFTELRATLARTETHFRALIADRDLLLRNPDRDNLRRYREANAKLGDPQPSRPRVVFLGDSIIDLWRLNEYFPDADYVNRGISGQISGEMLGRFKADVIDLKPSAVVILAGTNDIARGISASVIEDNCTMMADLADRYGIRVIFATLLPVSDYHKDENAANERSMVRPVDVISEVNNWLRRFSAQRGYGLLDFHSQMADSAGMLKAELSDDGLHPNSAGYRIMAPLTETALERTLAPSQRQGGKRRPRK